MRLVDPPAGSRSPHSFWLEGPIERLHIDPSTSHAWETVFDTSCGDIAIEKHAFLGHRVMLIAGAHDYREFGQERMDGRVKHALDIRLREGCWLASGVLVTGPADIGEHAVVTIGTVVRGVVPAYAMIGPAEAHNGKAWKVIGDVRELKPARERA